MIEKVIYKFSNELYTQPIDDFLPREHTRKLIIDDEKNPIIFFYCGNFTNEKKEIVRLYSVDNILEAVE